jgi:hypothetical protein
VAARVRRLTEKRFMAQVVELARLRGWLVFHPYDSRRSQPGFPDLVLVRGRRLLFAELKVGRRELTADQQRWVDALRGAGQDVRVWRPTGWPEIEAALDAEGV